MAETYNITKPVSRFLSLLKTDKQDVINIYIYAVFNGLVNLSLPLGIQAIINLITGGQISTSWIMLILFVLSGVLFSGVLQLLQLYTTENLQQKLFTRNAFDFTYRIPRIKLDNVDQLYIPEIVNRFFDITAVQKGLSKILIDFSSASLQAFFGLILLSLYHPFFIIYSLLLIILVILIIRFTGAKGLLTSLKESTYKYQVVHWLEELARTLDTFKLAGKTDLPYHKTDEAVTGYLKNRKEHFKVLVVQSSVLILFKLFITAGLLVLGGLLVIDQEMNLGQFVAAEIIILLVITSVEKIILSMETIYDVLTSTEKVGMISDLELENMSGKNDKIQDMNEGVGITLRDVSYKFNESKFYAVKNVNLDIQPNEFVCIWGFEGSGKSMLLKIISGIYENYEGVLLFNGIPANNYHKDSLRSIVSHGLTKEDTIFHGTLLENISLGRASVSFRDVKRIADVFGLIDYYEVFPKGYDTILYPEGKQIPKGIIMKILLARTLVTKPKLLIIEDAISRINKQDQEAFLNYVMDKNHGSTVIVVSNDKNIAQRCDKIVIMENGEISHIAPFSEIIQDERFKYLFIKG
ncbi:ATP-binding cassette domain-containing protein [Candidatus Kapaibacterium sp.]